MKLKLKPQLMHLVPATTNLIPIVVQTQTRIFYLYPQQILYLKAEHRKVLIYLRNGVEESLPLNIGDCVATLVAHGFFSNTSFLSRQSKIHLVLQCV